MNYESYRILMVDENPADRQLARLVLCNELPGITINEVETSLDFAEHLARGQFDIAITERKLSWGDGRDIIRAIRRIHRNCSIIVFATDSDASAVRWGPEQRPDEYLVKNGPGYLQLPEVVRRHLEQQLSPETRATAIVSRLPVGVFALNGEGRIVFANAATARLFDTPVARVIGHLLTAFLSEAATQEAIQKAVLSRSEIRALEGRLLHRAKPGGWVRLWLWEAEDDQDVKFEGLIEDVSELKATEERQYQEVEKLKAVSTERERFASTVAHELQSPMSRITRYAQLLVDRHADAFQGDVRRFLEQILDDGQKLQEMLDDLLDYARVGAASRSFESVDFGAAVDEAASNLELAFKETGGTLRRDELPVLRADRAQIVRLFQNLINNALKYHAREAPEVQISATKTENAWRFAVRDNGMGIAPGDHDRIFQLFQRLPQSQELPGTGIGLTICRGIVERHKGRIWVESNLNEGSTFYFTIPGDTPVRASEDAD